MSTSDATKTIQRQRSRLAHPKEYRVLLINDDFTPMDFVVQILESIFKKTPAEAVQIMLQVHHKGRGECGVYSHEIAEAKVAQVESAARSAGHPLQCTMEPT